MSVQIQVLEHALPLNHRGNDSLKDLFFAPIRFCGRQWMWINSDHQSKISQIVFRVLALPFLGCATLASGVMAAIGAHVFSSDKIPSHLNYSREGNLELLRRNTSNQEIAGRITDELNRAGCECTVEVLSMDREVLHNYYPEFIHRFVTLKNPSRKFRVWEVVKHHFLNKNTPRIEALYLCIDRRRTPESIQQLNDVLALHRSVTFIMAFDLAYVRTEIED